MLTVRNILTYNMISCKKGTTNEKPGYNIYTLHIPFLKNKIFDIKMSK